MAGAAGMVTSYTGPRPSPARVWAPWVILAAAACALGNLVQCALNLTERHYQQRRLTANPPSPDRIRHTISLIHTFSSVTLIGALVFLVVGTTWSVKRRTRARVSQDGEAGVEPRLRDIQPALYWTVWVLIGVSLLITLTAHSLVHPGMTVQNFVTYRTYLAAGNVTRAILWSCWIATVVLATQAQDRREALPYVEPPPAVAALTETVRSAVRVGAIAMLAAGGAGNDTARATVIRALRDRGLESYDDQWLVHDLNGVQTNQLWSYLSPLQGVDPHEKELIVRQIAAVGLADGPLTPAEGSVLEAIAAALGIGPADLHRIMSSVPRFQDGLAADGTAEPTG